VMFRLQWNVGVPAFFVTERRWCFIHLIFHRVSFFSLAFSSGAHLYLRGLSHLTRPRVSVSRKLSYIVQTEPGEGSISGVNIDMNVAGNWRFLPIIFVPKEAQTCFFRVRGRGSKDASTVLRLPFAGGTAANEVRSSSERAASSVRRATKRGQARPGCLF